MFEFAGATDWASPADWWKSMKQLLPSKIVETEDSVRYSSSEVGRLTERGAVPRLHAESAGKQTNMVTEVTEGSYAVKVFLWHNKLPCLKNLAF